MCDVCLSACDATCVVDPFLDSLCAGWRTFARGSMHRNSLRPAKIELASDFICRCESFCRCFRLESKTNPVFFLPRHTYTNEYIHRVVTKDTWESNRDREKGTFKVSTSSTVYRLLHPKGLKRFWKYLEWLIYNDIIFPQKWQRWWYGNTMVYLQYIHSLKKGSYVMPEKNHFGCMGL